VEVVQEPDTYEPDTYADEISGGFWITGRAGTCWVCGKETIWACMDIAYQHPWCDMWPVPGGDMRKTGDLLVFEKTSKG
jgi:hypothetical protein